jgi:hypothetical protein
MQTLDNKITSEDRKSLIKWLITVSKIYLTILQFQNSIILMDYFTYNFNFNIVKEKVQFPGVDGPHSYYLLRLLYGCQWKS